MIAFLPPLLLAFLLTACESGDAPGTNATATGDVRTAPKTMAPAGTLEILLNPAGVTVHAVEVSEQEIVYGLAGQAGIDVVESAVPWQVVSLELQAVDLHAALAEVLRPHPYRIIYEYNEYIGRDALARVEVGERPAAAVTATAADPAAETGGATITPGFAPLPTAVESTLSADQQAYLAQLQDPSPEVREEAAEDIEPVGIALDYLAQVITTDPSPEVRMAAAYTLEDSKDPRALDALIMALQDRNPEVLVEVIDALADTENRRALPHLVPLLDHPDEDVRDAAESAIEDIE